MPSSLPVFSQVLHKRILVAVTGALNYIVNSNLKMLSVQSKEGFFCLRVNTAGLNFSLLILYGIGICVADGSPSDLIKLNLFVGIAGQTHLRCNACGKEYRCNPRRLHFRR